MDSVDRQVIFCDLLRFYKRGRYSDFKSILKILYGDLIEKDRYLCHNHFISAQLAGLIEVCRKSDVLKWSITFSDELNIHSIKPKSIGTTKLWFLENAKYHSIVIDGSNRPLVVGRSIDGQSMKDPNCIFNSRFFSFFPAFAEAEKELCTDERFPIHARTDYEIFDVGSMKWKNSTQIPSGKFIAKIRVAPYTFTYYLIDSHTNLSFRIKYPEWIFIAAKHVLDFPIEKLFTATNSSIHLHQSLRLPMPLLRFVFGAAAKTTLCVGLKFQDVDELSLRQFTSYLMS